MFGDLAVDFAFLWVWYNIDSLVNAGLYGCRLVCWVFVVGCGVVILIFVVVVVDFGAFVFFVVWVAFAVVVVFAGFVEFELGFVF